MNTDSKVKRCFIDIETSGLDIIQNGILQIAGIIDIDSQIVETFNFYCKLFPEDVIDDDALEKNRLTRSEIQLNPKFEFPSRVLSNLTSLWNKHVNKYDKLDKFSFIGYNGSGFDMPWIRVFFDKCYHKYFGSYFWSPSIDVMYNASYALEKVRYKLKNFKLGAVAEYFGFEVNEDETHDAAYDIELTRKIFYIIEIYRKREL